MMKFQVVPLINLSPPTGIGRSRSRRIPRIPNEVRRKIRNGSFHRSQEPSSPIVSCLGQIKHKQNKEKQNDSKHEGYHIPLPTKETIKSPCPPDRDRKCKRESLNDQQQQQEKPFCISKLTVCCFKLKVWGVKPKFPEPEVKPPLPQENDAAPSLNRTTSLASGRGALYNFDRKFLEVSRLQEDDRALFFR